MPTGEARRRIFMVAGEVSGDLHGAELARHLRALDPLLLLEGIGGLRMAAAGVALVEDSSEWGVVGWFEALPRVRTFLRRLGATVARLRADPPGALVLIDFPGFNLALLTRLGRLVPTIYYVPPMVAIRRGRRAERVAATGARLLPIFPFEADAYRRAGGDVAFVGHPAVDLARTADAAPAVRQRLGVPADAPVVGLLPGSRGQELDRLLPPMLDAARRIRSARPDAAFLLALASPIYRARVAARLAASGVEITVVEGARDVMAASTVLLMASGTAAVEAMVLGTPMVVTYRVAWPTWWFAPVAFNVRWVSIPNIMAGEPVVPELLQHGATPEAMSTAVLRLLDDAGAREAMRRRLLDLSASLGPPGAAGRAAAEVLRALERAALNAKTAIQ